MNLSNKELNIKGLITHAKDETIWLPEFQRPFVWDKNQVRLLVDSLFHDYTISSILLWEGGDELARRRVGGSIKEIKIPEDNIESIVYLLDGQQRATALTLAFTSTVIYRGNNIMKKEVLNLYWDTAYTDTDPELRWVFDDEKVADPNDKEKMIMLKEYSQQEIIQMFGTRFIKIKHAYKFDDSEAKEWFEDEQENLYKFLYEYNQKLNDIKTNVLARKVYDIEQKGTLEQVLEVFERINTKNTKLSIFDIMVAKTYRKFDEGFFDLRSYYKIINYRDTVKPDYFTNLEVIDLDKVEPALDDSDMLQLTMIMLDKKFKATEILKLKTPQLMDNTKYLHDKFQFLIGFMNQHFYIETEELWKYQPMMKFLASAITHFDDINYERQEFLKKWFWNTLVKNRYPGAQNERIAKDYQLISNGKTLNENLVTMIRDTTRNFSFLENITVEEPAYFEAYYSSKSQQIYRAMVLLLKSKQAKDFYNGLQPVKSGASAHKLEEHHIFPTNSTVGKELAKKYKDHRYNDIVNNIANISLITKETNNKRIKAKNPSDYISAFEQEYKDAGKYTEFIEIMKSQFIDADMIEMLKVNDFEGFMVSRTKHLYEQIEILCSLN